MLNRAGVCLRKFFEPLNIWNKRDSVMSACYYDSVEVLCPPVVPRLRGTTFSQRQSPDPALFQFLNPLHGNVILDKILISISLEQSLNVFLNHRVMAERRVLSMALYRPFAPRSDNGLLRELHNAHVNVCFKQRIDRRLVMSILLRPRHVCWEFCWEVMWLVCSSVGQPLKIWKLWEDIGGILYPARLEFSKKSKRREGKRVIQMDKLKSIWGHVY